MVRHLVFRCPECRATTNVHAVWSKESSARVACSSCQTGFDLDIDVDRGRNDREYYDRVRRYAAESRMDLASAYSVVEGIMAPEKTRRLPAASPEIPRSPSQPIRAIALLGALLISVALLSRYLKSSWASEPQSASRLAHTGSRAASSVGMREGTVDGPIVYQVDTESRLVKVSGSEARAVLSALCNPEFQTRNLIPYALAPADPAKPLVRIGILRDRERTEELRSVVLWLDPRSGRWTIGTGAGPVATEPVASVPAGSETLL